MKLSLLPSLLFLFVVSASAQVPSAQVSFLQQPEWKDVLTKARQENKAIFLDAYTNWCSWCKTMDKNTFTDSAVIGFMNENFVNVKMEMESGFGATLAMKYRVFGFPSFLVFSPEGKFIERTLGYQKPEVFLETLKNILSIPASDFPQGISASIEMPFPDFYKKIFVDGKRNTKSYPDTLTVRNFLAGQKDLTGEIAWSVLFRFYNLTAGYDDWIVENGEKLQKLYGSQELDNMLNRIISQRFKQVVARNDESALQKEIFPLVDKFLPKDALETKLNYQISFYTSTKAYDKSLQVLNELVAVPGGDYSSTVNSTCWDVYEKCGDAAVVHYAARMMARVVAEEPEYAYLDTYAALLFKSKDYAKAEEFALKAIEIGKKENQNITETEELLKKIQVQLAD